MLNFQKKRVRPFFYHWLATSRFGRLLQDLLRHFSVSSNLPLLASHSVERVNEDPTWRQPLGLQRAHRKWSVCAISESAAKCGAKNVLIGPIWLTNAQWCAMKFSQISCSGFIWIKIWWRFFSRWRLAGRCVRVCARACVCVCVCVYQDAGGEETICRLMQNKAGRLFNWKQKKVSILAGALGCAWETLLWWESSTKRQKEYCGDDWRGVIRQSSEWCGYQSQWRLAHLAHQHAVRTWQEIERKKCRGERERERERERQRERERDVHRKIITLSTKALNQNWLKTKQKVSSMKPSQCAKQKQWGGGGGWVWHCLSSSPDEFFSLGLHHCAKHFLELARVVIYSGMYTCMNMPICRTFQQTFPKKMAKTEQRFTHVASSNGSVAANKNTKANCEYEICTLQKNHFYLTAIAEIFVRVKILYSSVLELLCTINFRTARTVSHTLVCVHRFRVFPKFILSAKSTKKN